MSASFMHWPQANGEPMTYGDASDATPVPRTGYRCKAKTVNTAKLAHSHPCKLTIDHDGQHACVCGQKWDRAEKVGVA